MITPLRALAPFAVAIAVSAAPALAAPAAADGGIIPLPLNPVVPAAQRVCSAKTGTGLGYTMLRPATGDKPNAEAYVLVNYVGYLAATGAVFDQGMHAAFPVNGVVPGFGEGVQLAARNGVVRLCVPAALGYGARENGPIPANSDLVFQVELVDFKTAAEVEAMRKAAAASEAAPAAPGKPR